MDEDVVLARKLASILPRLNERQRRTVLAAEARALGHGGVTRVARAAQVSRTTVHAALAELDTAVLDSERSRRQGGGRASRQESDPTLVRDLETLIRPTTRGDPMSPLRWTCKSTRQLAAALQGQGHPISYRTVARLLRQLDYSLQAPRKVLEGGDHPDRDAQFDYLNGQVTAALAAGQPVVSVDAKKKELVGPYKNGGQEWQPQGRPERVNVHDFVDKQVGKAIPYGIDDVGRNAGWVNVGQDHDTAQFAIESLRRWWQSGGRPTYPQAERLLVCADGGAATACGCGSGRWRYRRWPMRTACGSPSATSRRGPANGTRSNTACLRTSA